MEAALLCSFPSCLHGLAVILAVQSVANIVTATILELELRFPLYFSAFSHRSGNCSRFSLALFVVSISALSEDHKLLFYAPCLCSSVAISRPRAAWDFWNPRENCPCTLQLDTRLGAGEGLKGRDLGERCLAGDEPKLGAARGCLASQIQGKGEVSHGPVAGLLLTDLLLVVGGLAPSHALPEGTGSHRKGLLSPEPMAAVWAGSCHVGPVAGLGLGDALDALLH